MFKNQYNDVKPVKLKTYSSVHLIRNKIFVRGIDEQSNRVSYYDEFQPTVWVPYEFDYREYKGCLLYTSPSPRDPKTSRMPSSA